MATVERNEEEEEEEGEGDDDDDGGGNGGESKDDCFCEGTARSSNVSWTVGGGDGICIATSEPSCLGRIMALLCVVVGVLCQVRPIVMISQIGM